MNPKPLSAMWPAIALPADNHLRQSIVTSRRLTQAKRAVLAAIETAAVVIGSVFATPSSAKAQTNSVNDSAFQSVSIQQSQPGAPGINILIGPDSFRVQNYPLRTLIAFAYDTQDNFVSGPAALDAKYNVEAKAPGPFPSESGYAAVDAARAMVRQMLASEFQLTVHNATQSISAYVLTTTGGRTLMKVAQPTEPGPRMNIGPTFIRGEGLRMDDFIELLSTRLGRPVVDETGLTQTYDFKVDWGGNSNTAAPGNSAPALLPPVSPEVLSVALQTQLGLTMQLLQSPFDVLIVDSLQRPKNLAAAHPPASGSVQDGRYHHDQTGIEFDLPPGFSVQGTANYINNNGWQTTLVDSESGNAAFAAWMAKTRVLPNSISAVLAGQIPQKIARRKNLDNQYKIPSESIQKTTIGEQQAIKATAHYVTNGKEMVELLTWILSEHTIVHFYAMISADRLPDLQWRFDQMVQTAQVP